jgi:hypothetical protein
VLPPVVIHPPVWRHHAIALVFAAGVSFLALPAGATSASQPAKLDLRLTPTDIAPAAPPRLPQATVAPRMHDQGVPEIVGEVDRVKQTETPNRRLAGTGPLGDLAIGEGMLQELLENKTIPLFRIRVAPPF